jgi:DNA replicative helicase MCM subunit Mcm2 (Cdc46/Mcm family)
MKSLRHLCDNCGSDFTIKYDDAQCETDPLHCPFCAEYIVDSEEINDDDE